MKSTSRSKNNLVANHDWLLPTTDDIGFVSFHFPCHNLWGDSHMVFEARYLLTMVADDRDDSDGSGAIFRQIRDRHFPDDLVCGDMPDLESVDEFLTELEALEQLSILAAEDELSEQDEPTPYVPDIYARPPRQTRIGLPATKRTVATALEFETRYLLSLIVKNGDGSPRQRWWETLTEIFYPQIEPPEFQRLPSDEAFRKEHYASFLRYLAMQAKMSNPTHPGAMIELEREFVATRKLLMSLGFVGYLEPYRPGEDDITETCEKLCAMIGQLPAGVLNLNQ